MLVEDLLRVVPLVDLRASEQHSREATNEFDNVSFLPDDTNCLEPSTNLQEWLQDTTNP